MHFLRDATIFLKTRIVPIPRVLFATAAKLWLSFSELDFLCRLFDFNVDGTVRPRIEGLAENAGANEKTYRRAAESLKAKGLLDKRQIRLADGKLSSNSYDLSGIFSAMAAQAESGDAGQLRLFSRASEDAGSESAEKSVRARFGEYGAAIVSRGFFFVPRAMDAHLSKLGVGRHAALVAKYLFSKAGDDGKALVRVREICGSLPVWRTKVLAALAELSAAGLLEISERSVMGRKACSQYDLSPLVAKLESMEKKKVRKKLEASGAWKERKRSSARRKAEKKKDSGVSARFAAEAAALRAASSGKSSAEAAEARALEAQASAAANGSAAFSSVAQILAARMAARNGSAGHDRHEGKAREVCRKVRGNWERNRKLYFKAVTAFPNTVDRMVAAAVELATSSPEKYFAKCVGERVREKRNRNSHG